MPRGNGPCTSAGIPRWRQRRASVPPRLTIGAGAGGLLRRARGEMRVGPVGSDRVQGELDPERALLPEADGERAARLPVQAAIAVDFWMMLHQVARAPRPERLLV